MWVCCRVTDNLRCLKRKRISYHVSIVGVESLINKRELIWTQPLLIIDQLGKLVQRRKKRKRAIQYQLQFKHRLNELFYNIQNSHIISTVIISVSTVFLNCAWSHRNSHQKLKYKLGYLQQKHLSTHMWCTVYWINTCRSVNEFCWNCLQPKVCRRGCRWSPESWLKGHRHTADRWSSS